MQSAHHCLGGEEAGILPKVFECANVPEGSSPERTVTAGGMIYLLSIYYHSAHDEAHRMDIKSLIYDTTCVRRYQCDKFTSLASASSS